MNNPTGLEIAIIGINGKFPGANNLEEYWQNLRNGVESITNLTDEQIQKNGVDPTQLKHPNYVKRQAIIDNIEYFDAEFFGFNPREAEILDPQHRLFLECAWTALEDAGYNPENYTGAIGVYAGAAMNNYLLNLITNPQIQNQISRYQLFLSNDKDFLTTRVSYKLNLRGPSLDIQTACSTSLVAVHVACQSLLSGECDIALAGGVSLAKATGYLYQEGGIYSPDGHCRAFDADAQGTIAGSGLGIVVLKRLQEAIEDRDYIHAVIKGSAINNDGGLKVSYTAPRIDTQAAVIRAAQALAGVEPADISYIETHGTGTALGDPIEIAALTQAFRAGTEKTGFCAISSVKTNIGHLDAAAGIASLIKTVLALKHQQIPPNLHFQQPNPQIDFSQTPFYVNTNLVDWETDKTPRRAGVSSFGIGGTNAHVILEEAPIKFKIQNSKFKINYQMLCLSAKSEKALEEATINLATYLQQHPQFNLADIAYTLHIGRQHFAYRRMVLCQTTEEAAQILEKETKYTHTNSEKSPSIAFMFPGQGSHYLNMGKELYETEAIFREQIDHCCELLQHDLGLDLLSILFETESIPSPQSPVPSPQSQTIYAQPALFIIEYALAKLWISWGIQPQAMIGHSLGEYVVATLAGVFSLPDVLKLVALRGRLMQQCPTGAMLSVGMSAAKLQPLLTDNLVIAAYNAPELCVVSGTEAEIVQLETNLNKQGISNRRLQTSHAFHSPLMESMITPFIAAFQKITLQTPKIPFISNVTGTWITAEQATDPHYWVNHLRQPVQFATGIKELLTEPQQILLEVGAGRTLATLAKQQTNSHTILSSLRHPQDTQSDVAFLLQTLGQLWLAGVSIDWENFYTHQQRQRLPLPTYPFQRQRYWIDLKAGEQGSENIPSPRLYLPSWERSLPHPQVDIAEKRLCWLVFTDNYGIYQEIINTLQAVGHDVIIVSQGEKYDQPAYRTFTVNPQNSQDFVELWSDLELRELIPHHILYLWDLTDLQQQPLSLLYLAQAISSQSIEREITLTLVTNDGQLLLGNENIQPMKATVWGMGKVISQEIPQLTCRCVDISLSTVASTNEQIAQQLITECLNNQNDSVVAYRGNYRWNQIYKPLLMDDAQSKISVHEGGNYVILGDLTTGLGTVFAEFLMKNSVRLVLLSDVITETLKQSLDNVGIDYLSLNIDITKQAELENAIAQAETKFGQINGVFYSTPMSNEHSMAFLPQLTTKHWEYNYRTKIQGLCVLAEVLRDKPLDFCVLQSSLSTVLGGLGLAVYAAANAVIDMFAIQQNQNSKFPWISINWDACRSDLETDINHSFAANLVTLALTPAEVWQSTQHIIKLGLPESVVVTKSDLDKRLEKWVTNTPTKTKTETNNSYTRPQLTNEYIAPRDEIETAIAQIWQDLLGISPIGINDSFFDLGGHSLLAIQAISRLRDRFGVELSMRNLLYEAPTIAAIATIITTQNQNLEQMTALLTEIQTLTPEQIRQQLNHLS
ncbi:SDR family NAD(P)-dependent oxidoreductase [Anabaena sp. FACHB-709]|uniref:Polyketide synthase type I n=2 Tax=Nostocaceae TaxID=1162 RepID=A0A1Z4KH07_ANAVA|nr:MULTISPECIES: type I polyketide synthase [Nostocaceae]BAY68266.1 polyketide synthase type I [Trichormus variabilis NIES-23]HBW33508.1 KR domain-containing protein [Nostoc sp. UBA8866]MBD2169658.1 SDR family NAD(P)-dependent oxidoreductase [Anabaena cylindrica FACHB-318]MBD2261923.1 SDR family NAD(P)-dependent oxidoreductase [Anabaena sp. FACHB-709]MBD2271508.1 SDR family NAD(P)-dependent oxidoreductase [Nostoc sp. PCC 7120 = FACHB-418]